MGFSLIVMFAVCLAGATTASALPPSTALRYIHDEDGRLKAVTDPEGQTALYNWDPAGNLKSVSRHSSAVLSFIGFSPAQAFAGERVEVQGTGFSTTPASNVVEFGGIEATVVSSTATSLMAEVPEEAESGPLTVSVPGEGPVSSSQSFNIVVPNPPVITSVSPVVAKAGDEVTVSGNSFDPSTTGNVATFNMAKVEADVESSTSFNFLVPASTFGGHVSVRTEEGSDVGPDLFVPPAPHPVADVGSTGRVALGGSDVLEIAASGKISLELFDAQPGERIVLAVPESTLNGQISIWSPNGNKVPGGDMSFGKSGSGYFEPVLLREGGTYTVMMEGWGEVGSAKLAIDAVVNQTGTIVPTKEGTKQTVTLTGLGQNALFSVPVKAGQVIAVKASSSSFGSVYSGQWRLPEPNGDIWASNPIWPSGGFFRQEFSMAGTYTLAIDPVAADAGSVTLTVYDASDIAGGTLTPSEEGKSGSFPVEVPGQHNVATFAGSKEQAVSMKVVKGTFYGSVTLKSPKGVALGSVNFAGTGVANWSASAITLPENGTYSFVVEGAETQTGSVELTAFAVKDQTGSVTPTEEGAEQALSLTAPGQKARFSVPVSAGETVTVKAPSSTFKNTYYNLEWYKPGGEYLGSGWIYSSGGLSRQEFAAAGTYTLVINPIAGDTGATTLTLYDASDITGGTLTPSEEGDSETFPVEIPGQHNVITFSGVEEQEVSLSASESNFYGFLILKSPKNATLRTLSVWGNGEPTSTGPISLTESGSYTLILEGAEAQTGTAKVTAYLESGIGWRFTPEITTEFASLDIAEVGEVPVDPRLPLPGAGAPGGDHSPSVLPARPVAGQGSTREGRAARRADRRVERSFAMSLRGFRPSGGRLWNPPHSSQGGRGWETDEAPSPWVDVPSLRAMPGETALAGRVLVQNGLPLQGVRVSIADSAVHARTDSAGRFLLSGAPVGHQVLVVNGDAPGNDEEFGSYEIGVDLAADETTTLEYTVWLTALNPDGSYHIDSLAKGETRLKIRQIPGLEVVLPAGTVVRGPGGRQLEELNVTAVPVDRPPSPLPAFQTIPLYFTLQPGRAYLSKGAQIVYPNWTHLPAGQRVPLWNYDANDRGWYIYGRGTVTLDAKRIVPDPGARIWEFTGAMVTGLPIPPSRRPTPGAGPGGYGGDPVDLHSGLLSYHKADLVVPDVIPIVIDRTFRQDDSNVYTLGRGTKLPYDIALWSANVTIFKAVDLILADGGRVHFERTSPGVGYSDAIYRSANAPGEFFGSTLTWNSSRQGWNMKLTNGLTYIFGFNAPLQAIEDEFGNELKIIRIGGQAGLISKIVSPHGRWVKFNWEGGVNELIDNAGRQVNYKYNGSNLLTSATDPEGRVTKYEYDGSGNLTSVTNGRGIKYLESEYDEKGRVEKQIQGDGGIYEFTYELNGEGEVQATTVEEPDGSLRKVEFNSEGFPISETVGFESEEEQTMEVERQAKTGLVLSVMDPVGRETAFEYDGDGNVTKLTRLLGAEEERTLKFSYEPGTSNLTTATDALGQVTEYEYGPDGELLAVIDPLEHEATFKYNGEGQLAEMTDPEGVETQLDYVDGDLASRTDALGREATQFSDALGRAISSTSPAGERTMVTYNENSEPTSWTQASGARTTIEYDKDGNASTLIDPRGNETSASYDQMDRLESITDPLKNTAEWSYDGVGHLIEATNRRGQLSDFEYDALGRVRQARYGLSGEAAEQTVGYEYDEANRIKEIDDTASGEYSFGYDELDQLEGFVSPNGAISYLYDEAGRREEMAVPGQEPVEYFFDEANRLTEIVRGGDAVLLEYDKANRPEAVTLPDGVEKAYGYDEAGALASLSFTKGVTELGTLNYGRDRDGRIDAVWGNLARASVPETLSSTKYNAANQLVERESKELEYDEDGNLLSDGSSEYEWNAQSELLNISGGVSASFAYDPLGHRIAKTISGSTTEFLYDGPNVVQEAQEGSPSADLLTGLQPDQVFSRTTEAGTDSYLTDANGSTIALANGSGEVKTSYTYDPFGMASSSGTPNSNPYQYTGRENDGTGLQYNRARYYSPVDARFISSDPSGSVGSGSNLYEYVVGDPVDFVDPTGLELQGGGPGDFGTGGFRPGPGGFGPGGPDLPPDVPSRLFPGPPDHPSIGPDLGNNLPFPGSPEPLSFDWDRAADLLEEGLKSAALAYFLSKRNPVAAISGFRDGVIAEAAAQAADLRGDSAAGAVIRDFNSFGDLRNIIGGGKK